ncbi:hypothetical protein EYF80_045063 [Liparis tanakae]|uniref:Uncharacterized protein n=1 Tax=Liparis tanakae TaxID=230148 RepID=A0A4Z2FV93_9TELE|nr:hypothetical protein EYF80_045063 [Liparis tanakae]
MGGSGEKQRLEGGRASTYWKATGSVAGRVQSADQRPSCMHDLWVRQRQTQARERHVDTEDEAKSEFRKKTQTRLRSRLLLVVETGVWVLLSQLQHGDSAAKH